jgi:hypothetical protein
MRWPPSFRGSLAMAIRTPNLALQNLPLDGRPTIVTEHPAHVADLLSSNVIEVEASQVDFTAIHTRVQAEVVADPFALGCDGPRLPLQSLADVIGLMSLIVHANQLAGTLLAITGPLARTDVLEREGDDGLFLAAPRAGLALHARPRLVRSPPLYPDALRALYFGRRQRGPDHGNAASVDVAVIESHSTAAARADKPGQGPTGVGPELPTGPPQPTRGGASSP